MNIHGNSSDRKIDFFPLPYLSDSAYSKITDFDQNTKDYSKVIKFHKSRQELRSSKVIVIGGLGCGKTSLVQRFVNNYFNQDYKSTIGVDFEVEQFLILNMLFNLQIWDTAGQERFKCIASAYYRGAQSIIVVFDLNDTESLYSSEKWLLEALKVIEYNQTTPFIFLVGTKKDILDGNMDFIKYKVHTDASNLAARLNAEYWPLSSLTGENVENFFKRVAALAFNQSIKNEIITSNTIERADQKKIGENISLCIEKIKNPKQEIDVFSVNKCC